MEEVTIKVKVPDEIYSEYEDIIDVLTNDFYVFGINPEDIEITEKELNTWHKAHQ